MKINDLIKALTELKQKYPHFDFNQFNLKINGKDVGRLSVEMESISIILTDLESVESEKADKTASDSGEV